MSLEKQKQREHDILSCNQIIAYRKTDRDRKDNSAIVHKQKDKNTFQINY